MLFYKGLNITSALIIFAFVVKCFALGRSSKIKPYSVRLQMEDSFTSQMLLLWQLLLEMLGLFSEPTLLLDGVSIGFYTVNFLCFKGN